VPDDGIKVVKPDPPANDTDVGVEGKYEVPSEIASGHAYITNHTDHPSTGDKGPENMPPNLLQFTQKCLVILDMPKLIRILLVSFEIPVGRRGNDKVNGPVI
jgi:hypothetical protein